MRNLFSFLLIAVSTLTHASAFGQPAAYTLRKIEDPKTQEVLFMACSQPTSCQVLGGGSFSKEILNSYIRGLKWTHVGEGFAFVGAATLASLANPALWMGFIVVPAAVTVLVGSSIYVGINHKDFDSYKEIQLLEDPAQKNIDTEIVLKMLDEGLMRLRAQLINENDQSNDNLSQSIIWSP
jgi:hypothetical protein